MAKNKRKKWFTIKTYTLKLWWSQGMDEEKKINSGGFKVVIHYKDIKVFFFFLIIFYKMWDELLWEKGKFWDSRKEELKKVPWILNNGKSENWDRVNFKKI